MLSNKGVDGPMYVIKKKKKGNRSQAVKRAEGGSNDNEGRRSAMWTRCKEIEQAPEGHMGSEGAVFTLRGIP